VTLAASKVEVKMKKAEVKSWKTYGTIVEDAPLEDPSDNAPIVSAEQTGNSVEETADVDLSDL
jgi:hypothetical protein